MTTGAAGTEATVENTGTNTNAVLEFTIPRGAMPTLEAGPVQTVPSGQNANVEVTENGQGTGYTLNLTIPQGPTGPGYGLNAYGGRYNSTQQSITTVTSQDTTLDLTNVMSANEGVDTTTANTITIQDAGVYEIHYRALVGMDQAGTVTLSVQDGSSPVDGTAQQLTLAMNAPQVFETVTIAELSQGDNLTLNFNTQASGANVTVNNAVLIVKMLD